MKGSDESRKEVRTLRRGILTAKNITRLGTWNVRTAYETGKLEQIIKEMKRYKLGILGVSEMRWAGSGKIVSDDITVLYSGGDHHERGVGILVSKDIAGAIIGWEPVSDRIITIRLQTRFTNVSIIQVYAPTNSALDQDKDDFYEQLHVTIDDLPSYDMKMAMGDFNAQIGDNIEGWEDIIGSRAMGERTDNGERLLSYCSANGLKIGGSLFYHKKIHKGTWRSPNGKTANQIYHICIIIKTVGISNDGC